MRKRRTSTNQERGGAVRTFLSLILWLVMIAAAINKAVEMAAGNIGFAVVLSLVLVVGGSFGLALILGILFMGVDKLREWGDDHTYM